MSIVLVFFALVDVAAVFDDVVDSLAASFPLLVLIGRIILFDNPPPHAASI